MVNRASDLHIPKKSYFAIPVSTIRTALTSKGVDAELAGPLADGLGTLFNKFAIDERLNYDVIEDGLGYTPLLPFGYAGSGGYFAQGGLYPTSTAALNNTGPVFDFGFQQFDDDTMTVGEAFSLDPADETYFINFMRDNGAGLVVDPEFIMEASTTGTNFFTVNLDQFEGQMILSGPSINTDPFMTAVFSTTSGSIDFSDPSSNQGLFMTINATESMMCVYGDTAYFTLGQSTAAPTAEAAFAKLYTQDNGSGKMQLCVLFPTGAAQVIATEP